MLYKAPVSQILPGGHSKHSSISFAPLSKLKVPLGQLRHTFDNIIERYVPTEHVVGNFVYFNKH